MGGALRIRGVAMRPWPVSIEDVSAAVRVLMRNATIFKTFLEHRCSSMTHERVRLRFLEGFSFWKIRQSFAIMSSFTFTFTLNCHLGKTHDHRSNHVIMPNFSDQKTQNPPKMGTSAGC